jgi:hypothetical protein
MEQLWNKSNPVSYKERWGFVYYWGLYTILRARE